MSGRLGSPMIEGDLTFAHSAALEKGRSMIFLNGIVQSIIFPVLLLLLFYSFYRYPYKWNQMHKNGWNSPGGTV
jgi:hypothetical protein